MSALAVLVLLAVLVWIGWYGPKKVKLHRLHRDALDALEVLDARLRAVHALVLEVAEAIRPYLPEEAARGEDLAAAAGAPYSVASAAQVGRHLAAAQALRMWLHHGLGTAEAPPRMAQSPAIASMTRLLAEHDRAIADAAAAYNRAVYAVTVAGWLLPGNSGIGQLPYYEARAAELRRAMRGDAKAAMAALQSSFAELHGDEFEQSMARLQQQRLLMVKTAVAVPLGALVLGIAITLASGFLLGGLAIWMFVGSLVLGQVPFMRLRKAVKLAALNRIAAKLGLLYHHKPKPPIARFSKSNILARPEFVKTDDGFEGTHNGLYFWVCEARVGMKGRDEPFDGLLMEVDVPWDFRSHTVVMPRHFLTMLSWAKPPKHLAQVELEDPEFMGAFAVASDDQVEARALLTPAMMSRILALGRSRGRDGLQLAFIEKRLIIAIEMNKAGEMFELGGAFEDPYSDITDPKQFRTLLRDVGFVLDVVDSLKLHEAWPGRTSSPPQAMLATGPSN